MIEAGAGNKLVDPDKQVERKLDELIGTQFDTVSTGGLRRKMRNNALKWALGVAFAVAAAVAIVTVIETHRLPPVMPRAVSKPVPIQIVPEPGRRQ